MIKKEAIALAATLAAMFVGCQKQEFEYPLEIKAEFTATIEGFESQTKTSMNNKDVTWSRGDQVAIFYGNSVAGKYQVTDDSAGTGEATFNRVDEFSDSDLLFDANVAFYPYKESLQCESSDIGYLLRNYVIPDTQFYCESSFGNGAFPMVAVNGDVKATVFRFRNICGAIKLQLKGVDRVKSIKIEGKENEKLSGPATIIASEKSTPVLKFGDDANSFVVLYCGEDGVELNENVAKEFIIAVPPVVFKKGFIVTIKDINNNEEVVEAAALNTVYRSTILAMPEISLLTIGDTSMSDSYIDEYDINHGAGIEIEGVVWAPVNCGYHREDFPFGKLYQWGRRYGQGYSGDLYNAIGDYMGVVSDASVPLLQQGPVSCAEGQDEANKNVFFVSSEDLNYEWMSASDPYIWNAGTEEQPVKTENDPCPQGWRVPTCSELESLHYNHSDFITREDGSTGYWFSASKPYSQEVPRLFLPAPGYRVDEGDAYDRGVCGLYWSSGPQDEDPYRLYIYSGGEGMNFCSTEGKARGYSVRCVQESGRSGSDVDKEYLYLDRASLVMAPEISYTLKAGMEYMQNDNMTLKFNSSDPQVASVDQNGKILSLKDGKTTITVVASNGVHATCSVRVMSSAVPVADYVDEYGVNHGKGCAVGEIVWAPVNCGYRAANGSDRGYEFGKLYQWGRKYGQGYKSSSSYEDYYEDATYVTHQNVKRGPVSLNVGQSPSYADYFIIDCAERNFYNWCDVQDNNLWGVVNGKKSVYEPCPPGWRVPTLEELRDLSGNYSQGTVQNGQNGFYLSGVYSCIDGNPMIFLPAAGINSSWGDGYGRNISGEYWSSTAFEDYGAKTLRLDLYESKVLESGYDNSRDSGLSIRCVQE